MASPPPAAVTLPTLARRCARGSKPPSTTVRIASRFTPTIALSMPRSAMRWSCLAEQSLGDSLQRRPDGAVHQRHPGNQLPSVPAHKLKAGFDYWLTKRWRAGADIIVTSDQFFRGDEANQNASCPAMSASICTQATTSRRMCSCTATCRTCSTTSTASTAHTSIPQQRPTQRMAQSPSPIRGPLPRPAVRSLRRPQSKVLISRNQLPIDRAFRPAVSISPEPTSDLDEPRHPGRHPRLFGRGSTRARSPAGERAGCKAVRSCPVPRPPAQASHALLGSNHSAREAGSHRPRPRRSRPHLWEQQLIWPRPGSTAPTA